MEPIEAARDAMNLDLYDALPIPLQNLACTASGFARFRARFGAAFDRKLAELEKTAEAPVETLYDIQWRRLERLLDRARRVVPYYADLARPIWTGDPASSIATTLAQIPVLEKSTYRERHEEFVATDLDPRRIRRGRTSGTTGTALPLYYTLNTLAEEYATVWRMRSRVGAIRREPYLTFNGQSIVPIHQQRPPFWRYNAYSRQTLFSIYHINSRNEAAYVDALHRTPARYADGYPSALFIAARALLDAGRPLPKGRLGAVFTSSESLLAFHRDVIEAGFGAPVYDRFGTAEFAVSMTSCAEHNLHVDMEFGIVEVEPKERAASSVAGPIIVTGLAGEAAPLIRYRIGDVGTRLESPCPCGRPGEVFSSIDGRQEDFVLTPEGSAVGRMDHVFKDQTGVVEAQIVQDEVASIHVKLVADDGFDARAEAQLMREIRSRLGDRIVVHLERVETIPREPNGKFRAVKSSLGAAQFRSPAE